MRASLSRYLDAVDCSESVVEMTAIRLETLQVRVGESGTSRELRNVRAQCV